MDANSDRLKALFAQALEKETMADRLNFLSEVCVGHPELRQELESLLHAHEEAGEFLRPTMPMSESELVVEPISTSIGRYKLLEKIGEGGFGVVFMAEQQEPVTRKVALKLIKAGMDTREVIARFEAERQALALMDHPNIAKVLDGGATESGRPYFVMELALGVPITEYCDQNHLPTGERLELFIKVCQAVQHAHQKGIIHRDLKPRNILVAQHDGEPAPKVIDFGVAKALGQKLTEKTLFTGFAQMIGTPAYTSPEQAEMGGLDIDTRSDIYSLGVVLYELLTSVTPFERDVLTKAALDEVRRMIRETEPPKPSTRLRALGDKLAEVAKRRHTEPLALRKLVRGDLDWIVMKCLEKDRRRRYEATNDLATEIRRFLKNEPVTAAAPSSLYRLHKFARRHRVALTTGSITLGLITAAGIVSVWQAVRALRIERSADFEGFRREYAPEEEALLKDIQVSRLLDVLSRHGKLIEVGQILDSASRQPQELSLLTKSNLLLFQANFFARTGRWQDAATNLVELIRLEPDVALYYFKLAPLLVGSKDLASYGQLAETITTRFGGTNNILRLSRKGIKAPDADWLLELGGGPEVPFKLAVACLIVPVSRAVTYKAAELAESGAALGKPWSEFGKGLAEYRMGHFAETVDSMKKIPLTTPPYGNAWGYSRDSEVYAVLAMAHWRLNHREAAREALAKGAEIQRAKLPKLESGDLGEAWSDWIISHALLSEAEALVPGPSDSMNE